ncbi:MAG: hypothetical protein NC548_33885 [Lachnospiraceae bacterium]|nr:hypothetical protein [Lachnospiraceae bacterium]
MEGIKITQIQLEKLEKEINKALAVSTVLENELGIQQDTETAYVVCIIKEYLERIGDMVKTVDKNYE